MSEWLIWGIMFLAILGLCVSPAALITYLNNLYKKRDKEDDVEL